MVPTNTIKKSHQISGEFKKTGAIHRADNEAAHIAMRAIMLTEHQP